MNVQGGNGGFMKRYQLEITGLIILIALVALGLSIAAFATKCNFKDGFGDYRLNKKCEQIYGTAKAGHSCDLNQCELRDENCQQYYTCAIMHTDKSIRDCIIWHRSTVPT